MKKVKMPSWGKWVLIGSVAAALIIMLVAWWITRKKINKVRDEYLATQNGAVDKEGKAKKQKTALDKRDEFAQELWDLEEKAEDPTPQHTLEYVMNTAIRNNYKKAVVVGGSAFEEESLRKLAGMRMVKSAPQLVFVTNSKGINEKFDDIYKTVPANGMIAIGRADKKDKEVKKLLGYLKLTGIRHEMLKIDKGLILVVK